MILSLYFLKKHLLVKYLAVYLHPPNEIGDKILINNKHKLCTQL
jgi:hypothetical protein